MTNLKNNYTNFLFIFFTLCASFVAPVQSSALTCESLFNDTRSNENVTKYEQLFTRGRGIGTYHKALGESFSRSFYNTLTKPDAHWLDSGAGQAIAVKQTLNMPEAGQLKATVVALETSAQANERLKVLAKRFLEDIPDSEIPKSDLITDVFGPLAYSGRPDVIVQKYLNNLKPHGEIYIFLGARHELYGDANKVVTASGKVLNLADWLLQIDGISAELIKTPKDDDGSSYDYWTMKITKSDRDVVIPKVELVHLKEGAPPVMMFRETEKNDESVLFRASDKVKQRLKKFTQNTTATDFLNAFRAGEIHHPLMSSIKSLTKEDTWLNVSDAALQVHAGMQKRSYDYSDTNVFMSLAQKLNQFRSQGIKTERFTYIPVTDVLPLQRQKNIKLITDYYGEFMASLAPDKTLKHYLNMLSDKGEIYLHLGQEYGGFGSESTVMTSQGKKMQLRQWLRQIPGLNVSFHRGGYYWAGGEWTFVKIKISNRGEVKIPELKLMGVNETADMPSAVFQEQGF